MQLRVDGSRQYEKPFQVQATGARLLTLNQGRQSRVVDQATSECSLPDNDAFYRNLEWRPLFVCSCIPPYGAEKVLLVR